MIRKKRSLTTKTIYIRCLILYFSLLLTGTTYAFSEATLSATQFVRLLPLKYDISTALKKGDDQLIHFMAYNVLSAVDLINRPNPNTPNKPDYQAEGQVAQITESFRELSLSQTTLSQTTGAEQSGDKQAEENINHLLFLLNKLKTTMAENPEWLLVLLWDIDGTVLYKDLTETELHTKLADALLILRQNKQLLLIYNTARNYYELSFDNWSRPYPEPDIVIAGEGSRYFFNRFISNPLFGNKTPVSIRPHYEIYFNDAYWDLLRPAGCTSTISARSLKNECPFYLDNSISRTAETLKRIVQTEAEYGYWQQSVAFSSTILFAYHKLMNKGASFSRLMNDLSEEFPSFRDKIKVVISAGDSLPDTAMMHPDMHYPFDVSYQETKNTPRLPRNTLFAGAVLSKAGELQRERFKPLFDGIETVNSKVKSILGIIEGTVTLLLKQTSLSLALPEF
ncbi:hypothetical protein NX722_23110 [Endozoicomonas gorgoniicola]|uniref:Uncharacterized protein n=1 Tax=Endozoicomonas gorgoniicola TaxID=1234144 RepID=A0ABT3N1F4_9GAMM|nr:hypothetical protein [Endozoicomonas gorgoniicola]MCW7555461.1 hypothetical protein [Endozoicomonas gorgoniicola]